MENLTIGLVLWFFGAVFTTIAIIILLHSRKKPKMFNPAVDNYISVKQLEVKPETELERTLRVSKIIFAWFIIVATLVLGYISEYVALFKSEFFIAIDFGAFLFAMWILIKTKK